MSKLFDIRFYCSGKYSAKGYNVAAIGENNKMLPALFPKAVSTLVYMDGIKCALLKADKEYHIVLMDVEQPERSGCRAVDVSGSAIKINLSFSSAEKNEEAVRKLFYCIYFHYGKIAAALYEAYDFCVTDNAVGYAFDSDKISALIKECLEADIKSSGRQLNYTREDFISVSSAELSTLLREKLPRKDGVIFAELSITPDSFRMMFDKTDYPQYVLNAEYRK